MTIIRKIFTEENVGWFLDELSIPIIIIIALIACAYILYWDKGYTWGTRNKKL